MPNTNTTSFYIEKERVETIELKIENGLDREEDYHNYEIEHEKNCSWKKKLKKKMKFSVLTLHFLKEWLQIKDLFIKTFDLNELEESGEINEYAFKAENSTLFLNC